jgi:hypothetical protein
MRRRAGTAPLLLLALLAAGCGSHAPATAERGCWPNAVYGRPPRMYEVLRPGYDDPEIRAGLPNPRQIMDRAGDFASASFVQAGYGTHAHLQAFITRARRAYKLHATTIDGRRAYTILYTVAGMTRCGSLVVQGADAHWTHRVWTAIARAA